MSTSDFDDLDQWVADQPDAAQDWILGGDELELPDPFPDEPFEERLADLSHEDAPAPPSRPRVITSGQPTDRPPQGIPWAYHLTSVENLRGIVSNGAIESSHDRAELATVGDPNLAEKRKLVRIEADGGKHRLMSKYVSFYFTAKTPMLRSIATERPETIRDLVILACRPEQVAQATPIVFTNGHSLSETVPVHSFTSLHNLGAVDLGLINSGTWYHTDQQLRRERKCRYQAEFLALGAVPIAAIAQLGALSPAAEAAARELMPNTCRVRFARHVLEWLPSST